MVFYVHALLLFTKELAYVFKNKFQEANTKSHKGNQRADFSFVAEKPYDVLYRLCLMLCRNVKAMLCII